jgi:recombination protein RecT
MTNNTQAAKTGTTKQATTPAVQVDKTIADLVLNRVKIFTSNRDIRLPEGYSPENALKSAWLVLLETKDKNDRPALEVCTKDSIANAMLSMVLQGLNPVKKQCDFLVYGNKLTLQREYHGTIALAKRYADVREAVGTVIYEGDDFQYSIQPNGYKKVTKHEQALDNIDSNKIKGAYATLIFNDPQREPYVEIMTMAEIRQAWMQGATKGNSPAHKNFPAEMSKKTVISRACKLFISSSDDSSLFDDEPEDVRSANARQQVNDNANKEEVTMDTDAEEVVDDDKTDDTPENNTSKAPGSEAEEKVTNEHEKAEASKIPGF